MHRVSGLLTTMSPSSKSAWLAVLCAFLLATPAGAQKAPEREAVRSQIDAYREKVRQAAGVFLDASKSDDQRAAAVAAGITVFVEKEHVDGAMAVFRNERESSRIRALALTRIPRAPAQDEQILPQILTIIANSSAPLNLRRASLGVLEEMLFSSMTAHERHDEIFAVLRELTRNQNRALREPAFQILAAHGDGATQAQLLEGLKSRKDAPLPPDESVRLLGLHPRSEMYPVLHQVLVSSPDEKTKVECVRLLGGYEPSRKIIVGFLQNPNESTALRHAALATLNANDPGQLAVHALSVIGDEKAPVSLRVYGILAVQQRRVSQKMLLSGAGEFDRAVQRLAEDSRSMDVREAARRYLLEVPRER